MNSTVWIIKEQSVRTETGTVPMDYSKAYDYGDIEFITTGDMPMYGGPSQAQQMWNEDVARFAAEYNPDTDFIITTGQPMAIFMVGWILSNMFPTVQPKFLVWRREENRYRAVVPDVSQFTD